MRGSYSAKVREAAKEFALVGSNFRVCDLEKAVGVQTYEERKKLRKATEELVRRKEFERVERGLYRYVGKECVPQKQQVMWRFLRMSRSVTAEDLQVVVGVTEKYAKEWLGHLAARGIVRLNEGGKYQLVVDTLEMPENEAKAERLRMLRERKKEGLENLERGKYHAKLAENYFTLAGFQLGSVEQLEGLKGVENGAG